MHLYWIVNKFILNENPDDAIVKPNLKGKPLKDEFESIKYMILICSNTYIFLILISLFGGIVYWLFNLTTFTVETSKDLITYLFNIYQPSSLEEIDSGNPYSPTNADASRFSGLQAPSLLINQQSTIPIVEPINNPPQVFLKAQN